MTDITRDLLISLCSHMSYMQGQLEALHQLDDPDGHYWYRESVALRQKVADHLAALADEPAVPQGREPAAVTGQPSDGEVAELAAWLRETGDTIQPSHLAEHQRYKRAAELLERQVVVPVAVSVRLPGAEETTEDGEVWIGDPGHDYPLADTGDYDWEPHRWVLRQIGKFDAKNNLHWLPAHALPLPEVGE